MRKQIFFVTTHGSIYQRVLPLIEERKKHGKIIIVVINDKLEMFFKEYTDFDVIRLHVNPNLITQKTKHKLIWNVIKSKREYKKIFGNIQDADIHFFSCSYAIVTFSYIKKLAKNNAVYQYYSSKIQSPVSHGLLPLVMKLISKIFLSVDVKIENAEGQLICVLSDKFYKNIIRNPDKKFDTLITTTYLKEVKQLRNKNILLLSSDITDENDFVSDSEALRVTNILMDLLKNRYSNCIIKVHPGSNKVYGKMKELTDFVPSYIPAEFLIQHDWKFVIGMVSTALITFAKESSKVKVISMVKMLEWKDTVMENFWLDMYGKLPILMPKNEEELMEIICKKS